MTQHFREVSSSPKFLNARPALTAIFLWFHNLCWHLPYSPWWQNRCWKTRLKWSFIWKSHSLKSVLTVTSLSDYIRRRCPWLCQGTKKQISNQKVFCEASPNGLPASADCLRGGQHGNVSSSQSETDSHLMCIWTSLGWISSFTPKCKQSLLFLSLDSH